MPQVRIPHGNTGALASDPALKGKLHRRKTEKTEAVYDAPNPQDGVLAWLRYGEKL